MAKKAYIGIDGVARKIKAGYIGVDGVARKIKKAYIGIGGVARPCWNTLDFYYGKITSVSEARYSIGATSVGGYALFAGGEISGPHYGSVAVDVYNPGLTRFTIDELKDAGSSIGSTTIGDYALFAGGRNRNECVDAYSSGLTKMSPPDLTTTNYGGSSATSLVDRALVAGSSKDDNGVNILHTYDKSLTLETHTGLSVGRRNSVAKTNGKYAVFLGGYYNVDLDTVDAFTSGITRITPDPLSYPTSSASGAVIGGYLIVGGGNDTGVDGTSYVSDELNVYNEFLTKQPSVSMGTPRYSMAAVTLAGYAIFAGGSSVYMGYRNDVDVFDSSLTRTKHNGLSVAREYASATIVGGYALIAGGKSASGYDDTVDAYTIQE